MCAGGMIVRCVVISDDSQLAVSGSDHGSIRIIDLESALVGIKLLEKKIRAN